MRLKLKAFGLGLLAALVTCGVAALNVSAKTGGHFISEAEAGHTIVNQESGEGSHQLEFFLHGLEGGIVCDQMSATGTAMTSTVTEEVGNVILKECHTTNQIPGSIAVDLNGCQTRITVAPGNPETTEQTNDLICPAGKAIEVTHPNCTITIPPQVLTGLTYTTVTDNGKHSITVDVKVQLNTQFHAGICIFTGTAHTGTFQGSTIVRALNTNAEPVGITAT